MFRKRRAPEPPVTGPRYESVLDEGKLAALQEGKSFLTFLAVLLYAVALNLPSKAVGAFYSNHKIFAATFLVIHIAAFLYMVSIALRSDKKHRIRKAVRACDAPRFGFDKRTYVSYEIFVAAVFVITVFAVVLAALAPDALSIAAAALMFGSLAAAVASRFVLFKANKGNMRFIDGDAPIDSDGGADGGDAPADSDSDGGGADG